MAAARVAAELPLRILDSGEPQTRSSEVDRESETRPGEIERGEVRMGPIVGSARACRRSFEGWLCLASG